MTDLMIIIGLTLASCIAVGLIGFALLHLVRYRSPRCCQSLPWQRRC